MNKKLFLIIMALVLCFFIAISSVSATEELDNQTLTLEDNQNEIIENNENENLLNDDQIGTFTQLNELISNASDGQTVYLQKDYAYQSGDEAFVNAVAFLKNNIVIDGKGHTINGNNQARILQVGLGQESQIVTNVTLKNINFVNAYNNQETDENRAFGALEFYGTGKIQNCNFSNNYAYTASAIAIGYGTGIEINNCKFINNTGFGQGGGAIRLKAEVNNLKLSQCWFENNTGFTYGGALYSDKGKQNDGIIVDDCDFINNNARNGSGALFYQSPDGTIKNSRFISNSAYRGGAIYWDGINGSVSNCIFIHNNATHGGAIYCSNAPAIYILTSNFANNSAEYGGAVYFNNNSISSIQTCSFYNNTAKFNGGSIFCTGKFLKVTNSNFTKDNAEYGAGLYLDVGSYVYGCKFDHEHAEKDGGGIYLEAKHTAEIPAGVELGVFSTNFTYCSAGRDGGAGYVKSDLGVVKDCILSDCTAGHDGGAGYIYGSKGKLIDSILMDNHADGNGGALYWAGNYGSITNTAYRRNNANSTTGNYGNGGAIYWLGNSGNITDCNFTLNYVFNGTGGSIMWVGSNGRITNCLVDISISRGNGAIAYISGNKTTITKSTFLYSNSTEGNGSIYVEGNDVNITQSVFNYNIADNGGAIFINGDKTYINECNFTEQDGRNDAGSIYVNGDDVVISNSIFRQGSALDGSGVYIKGANTHVLHSNFTHIGSDISGVVSNNTRGGSIYIEGNDAVIYDTYFSRNNAGNGASIYIEGNNANISHSDFSFAFANHDGGAIYVGGNNTHISSSKFRFLNATRGAAIFIKGNGAQIQADFHHCVAVRDGRNAPEGGAIYVGGNDATIFDSDFFTVMANSGKGGAIYVGGDNAKINHITTFMTLAGGGVGGAIFVAGNNANITYSDFKQAGALEGSGLYIEGNNTHVLHSNFTQIGGSRTDGINPNTRGGAIFIEGDDALIYDGRFFENNAGNGAGIYITGDDANVTYSTFARTNVTRDGSAIYIGGERASISHSIFNQTVANEHGGAIYIGGNNANITSSTIDLSNSTSGGAIYIEGNGSHIQANFTRCFTKRSGPDSPDGGAIYVKGDDNTISDSHFSMTISMGGNGGAIYVEGERTNITYSTFVHTSAADGSGIYIKGANTEVWHSNFTQVGSSRQEGIQNNTRGGGIFIEGDDALIYDGLFFENNAGNGAGIYITGNRANIAYSIFNRTNVTRDGSAIYIGGNNTHIAYSNFTQAMAGERGGAIYIGGHEVAICNSRFTENMAKTGGSIYVTGHDANITKSVFKLTGSQNGDGGAIYIAGDRVDVIGSLFNNTQALAHNGGAIYVKGDYVNIENSNFTVGIVGSGKGGSIYIEGVNANITYSNFKYGYAVEGGAIYIKGADAHVVHSNVTQFGAEAEESIYPNSKGGAIYIEGNNTFICETYFLENNAENGGSLYIEGNDAVIEYSGFNRTKSSQNGAGMFIAGHNVHIHHTNITASVAKGNGGALYITGQNACIDDSLFMMNNATSGGAIFITGDDANVTNSKFKMVFANGGDGGAIYIAGDDVDVIGSLFNTTQAIRHNGGAIYVKGNNVDIDNSNFTQAIVGPGNGGVIYIEGNDTDITYSQFKYGSASNGGAIYIAGENAHVVHANVTQFGSSAGLPILSNSRGGGIFIAGNKTLISDVHFRENNAENGGSLYIAGNDATIEYSSFERTKSSKNGAAMYILGNNTHVLNTKFSSSLSENGNGGALYIAGEKTWVNASSFKMTNATAGGAVYIKGESANISYSVFNQTHAIVGDGGAVYIAGNRATVSHSNLSSADARSGGLVYIGGSFATIDYSNFAQSEARSEGGAIYINGAYASILNSKFYNHNATRGGAVYVRGINANISNSDFDHGQASGSAGGIYLGSNNTYVFNSSFDKNFAASGGAMYNNGGSATILYSNFTNNLATNMANNSFVYGGAIYWRGASVNDVILGCYFNNNTAINGNTSRTESYGGAIYVDNGGNVTVGAVVKDSVFTNNYAGKHGGAINWIRADDGLIENCTFLNNTANCDGGAIYAGHDTSDGKNLTIRDCKFISNYARIRGGALSLQFYNSHVVDSNFTNNTAAQGGTIFMGNSKAFNTEFVNCIFTNSSTHKNINYSQATEHGGVAYIKTPHIFFTNCTFINSTVANDGDGNPRSGAGIYFAEGSKHSIVYNCTFIGGFARNGGGVYIRDVDIMIINSTFTKNNSTGHGAAVYIHVKNISIINSTFENNTSLYSSAAVFAESSNTMIINSTFIGNVAKNNDYWKYGRAGAVYLAQSDSSIINSTFKYNSATNWGGAVYIEGRNSIISNSVFEHNSAGYLGGAIFIKASNVNVTDSLIKGNLARDGAGLYFAEVVGIILRSTNITNNNATTGSGIYVQKSNFSLIEVKLLDNQAHASEFTNATIKIDANGSYYVTAIFHGKDNLLNSIWNDKDSNPINFTNVTYWSAKGVNTTSTIPELSTAEAGQNITVKRLNTRSNGVAQTDENGAFRYYFEDDDKILLGFEFEHPEDTYYTGVRGTTQIMGTIVIIEVENIDFGQNATVNVTLTDRDGNKLTGNVTVNIENTHNFTIEVQNGFGTKANVSGLNGGWHNATVIYMGNDQYLGSKNSTLFLVRPDVHINITKSANVTGNVSVQDLINYTIIINCMGPSNATGVNVTDTLDPALKYISSGNNGSYQVIRTIENGREVITWNIGNMTKGDAIQFWIVVKALTNGTFGNVAVVSSTEGGKNSSNTTNVTINPVVKLNVTKTVNATNVSVGDYVKFTINITNNGLSNATGINVTDVLNPAFKFNSTNVDKQHYTISGQKIIWNIPQIANGTSYVIELIVKVVNNGTFTNVVTVNCTENKTNVTTNTTNITVNPKVNLTIIKTANITDAHVGDLVNFTITVTNNGPSNATKITISDVLDNAFEYVGASDDIVLDNNRKLIWTLDKLANGTNASVWVVVRLLTNGTFINVATVNCSENKTDIPSNGTNVTVNPVVNLTVIKYANVSEAILVGDLIKFTINVTNHGPSNATDVTIFDSLSNAFAIVSAPGNKTIVGNNVTWLIPKIANGTTVSVWVVVKLLTNGTFTNVAVVNSTENSTNSTNSTNITVNPQVNLTIVKTADFTNVSVGDYVKFNITITNNGLSNATGINVTDVLVKEFRFVAANGTYVKSGQKVVWTIPHLANGTSITVWVDVEVLTNGTFTNVATVNCTENTTNVTTNGTNVTVNPVVNLTVIKYANVTEGILVGDLIKFTINVTNHGPSNATNVTIFDALDKAFEIISAPGNKTINGNNVTWLIPKIANGTTVSVWVIVKLLTNGTFTNVAVVNSTENSTNSTNSTNITVNPQVNLTIVKTADFTNVSVGDHVKFNITITNNGLSNATGINVTDVLVKEFKFVNATIPYTRNGQRIVWHIDKLENGTSITIWVEVEVLTNGTFTNVATVNCTENTTNVTTNGTNVTVNPVVNLTVIKYANVTEGILVGDLIKFTINVTNHGPSNATNVVVFDSLNSAFAIVSAPGNKTIVGNNVTWIIPKIANGTTVSVWVIVKLLTNGTFTNVAVVNSTENSTNSTNGTDITVNPQVNLTIVKTADFTKVSVGDHVKFNITITNNGLSNATGINVTDVLVKEFRFVGANGTHVKSGQKVVWTIPHLANGTSITVWVEVEVLTNGTFTNVATVNCTENTTNVTTNGTNVTVNPVVNLTVIKYANVTEGILVGDLIKFIINVTNNGPSNATNVTIFDSLNSAFAIVSAPGNKTINGNNVTWIIPKIANGTSASVWVIVKLLTNGTFTNVAFVNSTENSTNSTNGTDITVNPQVNLTIVKTPDFTNVSVGGHVKFNITITNNGLSNATGINVTDVLAKEFRFVGANGTHVEFGQKVVWTIPHLANGTSITVWVEVEVLTNGTFTNVATVNCTENTTNVTTNETNVTVNPVVNLTVIKYANVTEGILVGDLIKFTINVTNHGPSNATNVVVFDSLNSAFAIVSAPGNKTIVGNNVTWIIPKIANGTTVSVWVVVKLLTNGTFTNVAVVNSTENSTNSTNGTDITVNPQVNLTIVKSADLTNVSVGDHVKFNITITNNGLSNATGINVTDMLVKEFRFVGANGTHVKSGQKVVWTIPHLANGTSITVWVEVEVLTNGTFTNVATVNCTENSTNVTTNGTNVTVNPVVNLTVIKYANVTEGIMVGDLIKFIINVTNYGPSNATNVVVFDSLNSAFAIVSAPGNETIVGNNVTWIIPKIANGTTVSVWVVVKLLTNGTFTNVAVVNSTENSTNSTNGTDITVNPVVNLTVVKTTDAVNASVGQLVNFTIVVTNYGPSNATGVNVTDLLPIGMLPVQYGSNATGRVTITNSTLANGTKVVTWNIPVIVNGSAIKLWLLVNLTTNGTFTNVAFARSNENKTNISNTTNLTVKPVVDLIINKTVNKTTVFVGDFVEYIISVKNNGPSNATDVYVFDQLDEKLKYIKFTATQGEYDSTTHMWTIGNMTSGANVTLKIIVKIIKNGTISNWANVTGNENDTNITNNNVTSDNITALPQVNLTIIKKANVNETSVGQLINFTITVTNNGLSNATGINITDELIGAFEYINSSDGVYDGAKHTVVWNIAKLANGTSTSVWVVVKALTNGTLSNVVVANCSENTTNVTSNTTNVTVKPVVDLVINKTVDKTEAIVGDIVEFTITVTNKGPSDATGVNVTDVLDAKLKYITSTASQGSYDDATHVWTVGNITSGLNATLTIRAKVISDGTIPNMADVTGNENDTNITNNNATSDNVTALPQVNLTIIKKADVNETSVGQLINFTITVTNNGLSNATGINITDELIEAFEYINSSDGVYDRAKHTVVWNIAKLANGTSTSVWVVVKSLTNGTLSNVVVANCNENTTNVTSNTTNVTVDPVVDLVINKTVDKTEAIVGDIVEFTITVTNKGPSDATGVNVTDVLDAKLKYITSTASQGSYDDATHVWTIGNITSGLNATLTIRAKVISDGTIPNMADVTGNENDTNITNNNATSDNVTALPQVNLTIVKTVDVNEISVGQLINFTITVTNNGLSNATGINISDELIEAFEYIDSDGQYDMTKHTVVWNIAKLANGTSTSVWVQVRLIANGTFTNVASVNCTENNTVVTSNETNVTSNPKVNITVVKQSNVTGNASIGDLVNFTITVTNHGPSKATGVNITDLIPAGMEYDSSNGEYMDGKVMWNIAEIDVDTPVEVWVIVKVVSSGTLTNVVVVNSSENTTGVENKTSINVTDEKMSTPIRLETENITYGDDETITVTLPAGVTGTVNITVGNVTYPNRQINNGMAELLIPDLAGGEYNVTVVYPGDGRYEANSTNGTFRVSPATPTIKIEVADIYYGEIEVLNVTVNAPGWVNITIPGIGTIKVSLDHSVRETSFLLMASRTPSYDGKATWKLSDLPVDTYLVTATYLANENYTSASDHAEFKVMPLATAIEVSAGDIYVGEDARIEVVVKPGINGTVNVTVEGKNYPVNVTNGKGQLTIPGLKAGEKQVTAKYPGNETYNPSENSTTFKVKKIKPDLTVDSHDIYVGDDETITVTLPADATGKVTITVGGKKYTKDLENGKATFTIPGLKTGKYTVDASYSGDDKYLSTTGKDTFNVLKHKPDINVDSPDITVGEDGVVTVTLPDDATGSLTIEIDGKTYTANVKNGKAVFRIPGLNVGSYGIKVSYSGDDKYLPTKTTGEMNVLDKKGNDKAKSVKVQDSHATGNPIFVLFVVLISMIVVNIRKFKK